jgi:Exopolysaccharide biosynthesis protein
MIRLIKKIKHISQNLYLALFKKKKLESKSLDNTVLVMLAADYNNLGDIAITYAQKRFLKNVYKNKDIIEIPVNDTVKVYLDMKKKITPNTVITIIGGGNTGDKYELIERYRRFIIRHFKTNKIIIFPQTIDFSKTKYGKHSLSKSMRDYSKNSKLLICARESKSESIYKKLFKNKITLIPDIVFSLSFNHSKKRSGVLFLMRDDGEKSIKDSDEQELIEAVSRKYNNTSISDTCVKNFDYKNRYKLLFKKIHEISSKKVVITDRLHGMIFSYITNTPCIVLQNNNHKILMTYNDWLSKCNFIKLIQNYNLENILKTLDSLYKLKKINNTETIKKKHNILGKKLKLFDGK